ncbi:MAG: glycosyltransferase [Cohnella sp.]|nr:glycosyltransferase [Cohnella sp.]
MISFQTLVSDRTILKSGWLHRFKKPAISVIMPTYCRNRTSLSRAIDSVLRQTFASFELLIVDDGSTDGTFETLQKYRKQDPRITIIRHELHSGLPAARVNEAILMARGEYIAYQFDDDEWLPDLLATLYGEALRQGEPCAVYGTCQAAIRRLDGSVQQTNIGRVFDYSFLQSANFIANNSILHPKSVLAQCGMYDPHLFVRRLSDYDLWLRMSRRLKFVWVDKVVSKVYAGEKHSLAESDGIALKHYGKLRKYIEIDRAAILAPEAIGRYEVDGAAHLSPSFSQREIDEWSRKEIFPFRSRTPYYLTVAQRELANLSRPWTRRLALVKGLYSTSIDVTVKNYTNRLAALPYRYFFIDENNAGILGEDEYDVLVLYKTIGPNASAVLDKSKAAGKPSIYMMDDNMFKFHELGEEFGYLKPGTEVYRHLERQVTACDLVISYNSVITEDCKRYNPRAVQCRTNIPGAYVTDKRRPVRRRPYKFGIFTGPARKKEMRWLFPVLERFSRMAEGRVEFHFWGMNPDDFGRLHGVTHYRAFTNSYDQYLEWLRTGEFDFTLSPLDGTLDASRSKSPVKFLEGTAAGSVWICSDVGPYSELPNDVCIKTGNDPEEWLAVLLRAASMETSEINAVYGRAYEYVRSRYISEAQVHAFAGALEAAEMHRKLRGARIAYFFYDSYLGGATLHLLKHATFMKELGFEVLLCVPEAHRSVPDLYSRAAASGLALHGLPYVPNVEVDRDYQAVYTAPVIMEWMRRNNVGLAHSLTYVEAVGAACKALDIPHVASLHQFYASRLSVDQVHSSYRIDAVHSSSHKYADEWSRSLAVRGTKLCCAVDLAFFESFEANRRRLMERTHAQTIRVLMSGTVQPRKNQLEAIKAVHRLLEGGLKISLKLIGYDRLLEGYAGSCLNYIRDNGLEQAVELAGFETDPFHSYMQSDLVLCCSTDESMPQAILQAMAAGVPVVTTEVGGVRELVKHRYNGFLYEGTDAASIAAALSEAIESLGNDAGSILDNAYHGVKMVAHPDYVKSELVHFYNEAMQ